MNLSKLKQHPKVFARLLGVSPEKFDELARIVHPLWVRAEAKRLRHKRKIKKGSGRRYGLTFEQSLAMLLLYLRAYTTHAFLSALLNTHESGICRYFARLRPSLESVFTLPERNADLSQEDILKLVVDATEQPTERRKTGTGYSGKKKMRTIKTQLVVDKRGAIIHISPSVPGNVHDKRLFDTSL